MNDNSDYAKILRYAEYLQQTGNLADGQIALTKLMGYEDDEVERREREIKDIINRIIEKMIWRRSRNLQITAII